MYNIIYVRERTLVCLIGIDLRFCSTFAAASTTDQYKAHKHIHTSIVDDF